MRRLFGMGVLGAVVAVAMPVLAQTPQGSTPPPPASASDDDTRPAVTTVTATPGSGSSRPAKCCRKRSGPCQLLSRQHRRWPGLRGHLHVPGDIRRRRRQSRRDLRQLVAVVNRIDRDTRPLFFSSTAAEADSGTGGGILAPARRSSGRRGPAVSSATSGSARSSISCPRPIRSPSPPRFARRVKLPTGKADAADPDSVGTGQDGLPVRWHRLGDTTRRSSCPATAA